MFLIGLTGGIAAGKSTVAQRWVELGAQHIDADELARRVVEPGSAGLAQIVNRFGEGVLTNGNALDRAKLADLIFGDSELRKSLEGIIHPLVRAETQRILAAMPEDAIVVYNVPLLVEANVDLPFDRIVTVEAPLNVQLERLTDSRGLTPEHALARIKNQASPAARANVADFIINANQNMDLMLKDAGKLWFQFEREAELKFKNRGGSQVAANPETTNAEEVAGGAEATISTQDIF